MITEVPAVRVDVSVSDTGPADGDIITDVDPAGMLLGNGIPIFSARTHVFCGTAAGKFEKHAQQVVPFVLLVLGTLIVEFNIYLYEIIEVSTFYHRIFPRFSFRSQY